MKKLTVVLVLLMCLFAVSGCKKSAIQGDWTDAEGNAYTFGSDMTFTIDIGDDIVVGGTFAIATDSNQVVFTMEVTGGEAIVNQATFTIDAQANTLTFVGTDGTTTVLHQ